jgi:hypothetical protein
MVYFKEIYEAMKKTKKKNLQLTLEKCFNIEIDKKLDKQQNYDLLMDELKILYDGTDYKYINSLNQKIYEFLNIEI